jgi:hypothetical protein
MVKKQPALLFGLIALAVVVTSLLSGSLPLYDGIGFPDEPYRYVKPPTKAQVTAQGPTNAETLVAITQGTNQVVISFSSLEQGPQVALQVRSNAVSSPVLEGETKLKAAPMAPGSDQTPGGKIAGNFYRFSASNIKGQPTSFKAVPSDVSYVDLRLPQGFPAGATMYYRPLGGQWQSLNTDKIGNDIYQSVLIDFGDYGLVSTSKQTKPKRPYALFLMGASAVLLVIALIILRLRNQPKAK